MYLRHFGFTERPFRLVPDPAYLFLGGSHREAMAHLSYALDTGDGFASLTGEVGTGKTTLCRAFLESLGETVTSALIFNPPADPVDLLRAINRDFSLPAATDDLQDLIETLNRFLIAEKSRDRRVVLVIDEAQNLSRQVLEQIRLLSNLETARSKLIQIILVGQPELERTLAGEDLRQLRQRIALHCRLTPLSLAETGAYIRHRLTVAATGPPVVFTPGAVRRVYRFSTGIPRQINTVCDRCLLTAFGLSRREIDAAAARRAAAELEKASVTRRSSPLSRALATAAVAAVLGAATVTLGPLVTDALFMEKPPTEPLPSEVATPSPREIPEKQTPPAKTAEPKAAASPRTLPSPPADILGAMDRVRAMDAILGVWGVPAGRLEEAPPADDLAYFRRRAAAAGLKLYRLQGRPDLLDILNLPALVAVAGAGHGDTGYAVVAARTDAGYMLRPAGGGAYPGPFPPGDLFPSGQETVYVVWKDAYAMAGEIPREATGETVLTLKLLLRELGYDQVGLDTAFDNATRRAVIDFQADRGLDADGVVGSLTKIALYNTRPGLGIPRLRSGAALPGSTPGKKP